MPVDLNGLTGQIKISERVSGLDFSDSSTAMFFPRPTSELVGFDRERISLHDLLMLAVGCLPLPSGQYIALVDLWSEEELELDHHPLYDEPKLSNLLFMDNDSTKPLAPSPLRRSPHRSKMELAEAKEPVVLRLDKITYLDDEMERLKAPFKQTNEDLFAFELQTPDPALFGDLRIGMGATFMDPFSDYIRVPKADASLNQPSNIFIWRADAQKVAYGLLNLPWNPQGYLIGGSSSACCIQLLEFSGREFLYLLTRTRENTELLALLPEDKQRLKDCLSDVDKTVRREQNGVPISTHRDFCSLDELLANFGHTDPKVNDMIGILILTNEEFASFVRQSARHFEKSISGSLEVDMRTGYVKVRLAFGGIQDFPVDMKNLYADWERRDETITVNYTVVMLACLRASMRSYLLSIRFDGHPLIREILKFDDIVYIA